MFKSRVLIGTIRHRRFTPKPHQFSYRLFMFCFDIARYQNSFKDIAQVSIEKWNWFSFYRKNYLAHPELPLDEYARQLIQQKFNIYPQGKIYLLTHLACLGYCFNPISLYFIFNENHQDLDYLIIEVTNTPWGEKHHYILKSENKLKDGIYHYQFRKALHVSPFLAMNYDYQFNLKLTPKKIIVHMENRIEGKKDFDATLILHTPDAQTHSVHNIFHRYPLITYKVTAAIYWQALKLWLKGIPFHAHPKTKKRT